METTRRPAHHLSRILGAGVPALWCLAISASSNPVDVAQDLSPDGAARPRNVLFAPLPVEPSWRDLVFLCAVPAAFEYGEGFSPILTVDSEKPWRPEVLDFLRRYEPDSHLWLGGTEPGQNPPPPPNGRAWPNGSGVAADFVLTPYSSIDGAAYSLATHFWEEAKRGVVFEEEDRCAPLAAAALAARLSVPLLPAREGVLGEQTRRAVRELGIGQLLYVVDDLDSKPRSVGEISTRRIAGAEGVVRWLKRKRMPVEYLAVCNPLDAELGPARKLSFAAVLFAAGRRGAVATLPYDTKWKRELSATDEEAPAFSIEQDPSTRGWTARIDLDGDGALADEGEGPFRTGETIELTGRRWTVDLDAVESERGSKLWLTTPDRETIRADLARYLEAAGGEVEQLCLVGWPQALPSVIVGDAQGIDTDLVSDLPLADTDEDPFVELGFGRVITEDVHSAVLLANRSLAYTELLDEAWANSFATAEWEALSAREFESFGFRAAGHHEGEEVIGPDSPLTRASVILHGSHAMWTVLGKTYSWDSEVLLAPCFVESSGCSTASVDQDPEFRSVAARMLRNGAVAFVGNTRRGVAQQDYFHTELRNQLLAGVTLGEANRNALNRLMVTVLDEGEHEAGLHRYQLYNHAVYGDPALVLHVPAQSKIEPARMEVRGSRVTVRPPSEWWRYEAPTLEEWGSKFAKLHYLRGSGLAVDSWWNGAEKRNQDALWFTVEVRTRRAVRGVEAVGEVPSPLAWSKRFFVDEHSDGSRSILWRCRLVDFDMRTGEICAAVNALSFGLSGR
jgi:hypothetical protein